MLDMGAVTTIAVFIAAQTGALIYYAGSMREGFRQHEKRIDKNEDRIEAVSRDMAELKGR